MANTATPRHRDTATPQTTPRHTKTRCCVMQNNCTTTPATPPLTTLHSTHTGHSQRLTMSVAEASNAREVYERCTSHAELLKHTKVPAVKKVAHSIRSWKSRHTLATLDQAFAEHRQSILFPQAEAASARPADKPVDTDEAVLNSTPLLPPPLGPLASTASPAALPSPQASPPSSQQEPPAPLQGRAAEPLSEPVQRQQQQQDDLIAGLARDCWRRSAHELTCWRGELALHEPRHVETGQFAPV